MIGQVLDKRYKVTGNLAQGGFGHTYLAQDLKRPGDPICVVKQLKPQNTNLEVLQIAQKLFQREAEILEKLGEHPQIPRLLAYFREDDEFYLVQEYIQGQTLHEELDNQKILSEQQVITLINELLVILKFVHDNGVIHRDITPKNIIRRNQDNKFVLIDFGAVKEISNLGQEGGTRIGSPSYCPLEQSMGRPSYCSDLYAVGVIGIQALTGINPHNNFNTNESGEIAWEHLTNVKGHLANFLTKMVRQKEKERYQSATEALKALQKIDSTARDRSKFWQKLPLISLLILGISIFGIISTLSVKKFLSIYVRQLPVNGKVVRGILDGQSICQDMMSGQDYFCKEYSFLGKSGQKATIEMNSDDFDPFLILRKPDGDKLAVNGDISSENWNAKIVVDLTDDGDYTIIARTNSVGESGNYTIRAVVK